MKNAALRKGVLMSPPYGNQLDRAYLHLLIKDRGVRDWTCRAFSIGVDGKRNLASTC